MSNELMIKDLIQFTHKQVRALVWILRSPSIVSNTYTESKSVINCDQAWGEKLYQDHYDWLFELNQNPSELENWLEQLRSFRLGIRYERLIIFFFKYLEKKGIISEFTHNLPIYDEKKISLGELDMIYYDHESNKRVHLELSVKFYLFRPEEFNYHRFCGPNGQDWLLHKTEHLFSRQLFISNSVEGKFTLDQHFSEQLSTGLDKKLLIKGALYHPLGHELRLNDEENELINENVLTRWWTRPDYFYQADTNHIGRWIIIDKLDWIVPLYFSYQEENLLTAKEMTIYIKRHFSQSKRSIHLAYFKLDEESQLWIEEGRGFIVDKYWPDYKKSGELTYRQ
ncbi:MAG: DUF1853 family protein [Gammaproteobacteria bacterium]|nr:DUF1853 family protein [Gammaproteobacteria bacterium]